MSGRSGTAFVSLVATERDVFNKATRARLHWMQSVIGGLRVSAFDDVAIGKSMTSSDSSRGSRRGPLVALLSLSQLL